MSSHLIRSDLVPMVTGYGLLMIILAVGLVVQRRRAKAGLPQTRLTGKRDHGWPALLTHVASDALGGYLLLAAVVVAYYYGVAKVGSNFLDSAFTGAALLLAISLPVFIAASWLMQRRRQRAGRQRAESRPASGAGQ